MRYVGALSLVLAVLFGGGLIVTSGQANAATSVASPPVVPPPGGATLTQGSAGTWTASVYLDTVALCDDTFNLVTSGPDTENPAKPVTYDGTSTVPCGAAQEAKDGALTMVGLTFPSLPGGAIPQTATLAVTPSATALAAGAAPVEFPLTVRRQLTGASSLWTPLWFGLGFVLALVLLVASIGVQTTGNGRVRGLGPRLLRAVLYAPSAWTFGGSWATNFTALGTVIGGVLTATGAVAGIVPGVDLSRIGLLFAIFGVFAVIAPLVFATLNTRLSGMAPAAGNGDAPATRAWIMLMASSFTAFGMGASLGLIGWLLTYRLVVAPWQMRLCVGLGIAVVGFVFLANVCVSILNMASQQPAPRQAVTVGSAVTVGPTVTVGPVVPAAPAASIASASRPSLL